MKGKKILLGGKRFIIALLSIMTLLGMSPKLTYTVKAAETTYTVYVGGTEMSVGNDGSAIYYKNGDTAASTNEVQDWNAKLFYDTTNNALTLETNNLQVEGIEADDNSHGAGIYTTANLTINLTGENSIKGKPYGVTDDIQGFGNTYGIYADSVTLQGTGNLDVSTGGIKGSSYAIYAVNNININNTHVNATGGEVTYKNSPWNMKSIGLYADKGSIAINSSTVQAIGNFSCDSFGIKCSKTLSITGQSNVTATGSDTETSGSIENSSYGIYVGDITTINKSTVTAQGGKANYISGGLVSLHGMTIKDSTVTGIASGMKANPGCNSPASGPNKLYGITADYYQITNGSYSGYADIIIENSTVKGEAIKGEIDSGDNFFNFTSYGIRAYDSISITGGDVTGDVVGDETGNASYGISTDYNLTINGGAKVTAKASDAEYKSCGTAVWKDFSLTGNSSLKTTAGRIINPIFTNPNTLISDSIFRSAGLHMTYGVQEDDVIKNNGSVVKKDTFTIVNSRLEAKVEDDSDITVPDEYKVERSAVFLFDVKDDKFTFTDTNQTDENWYYWTLDENHDSANKHDSNDKQYVYTEDDNKQSDYLLIAPQSNQYMVKYDPNGGTGTYPSETVSENETIIVKEAPTKEGYEFKGWSDGSKTYHPNDTVTITQDTTFTAIWEKKEDNVKVKYEFGNGQSDVEETVVKGTNITLKDAPTKEGYTFKGWSDGSKTYQPGDIVTVSKDTIFTAVWEKVGNGNSSNGNNNGDNTGNDDTGNKENPSTATKEEPKTDVKENTTSTPEVKKTIETKETKKKKTKTGDESRPMIYVELGLMAIIGCAIIFLQSKKSQLLKK